MSTLTLHHGGVVGGVMALLVDILVPQNRDRSLKLLWELSKCVVVRDLLPVMVDVPPRLSG